MFREIWPSLLYLQGRVFWARSAAVQGYLQCLPASTRQPENVAFRYIPRSDLSLKTMWHSSLTSGIPEIEVSPAVDMPRALDAERERLSYETMSSPGRGAWLEAMSKKISAELIYYEERVQRPSIHAPHPPRPGLFVAFTITWLDLPSLSDDDTCSLLSPYRLPPAPHNTTSRPRYGTKDSESECLCLH
ncbi:hypothetical protein J6590_054127 [Homalodisca vitripennis]|nr:hypothetical protein J6590_054127 [Homalodisca vitripennis]